MIQTILIVVAVIIAVYILFKAAKVIIKVVIVCCILGIAYFTNPGIDKHRQAVSKKAAAENENIHDRKIGMKDMKVFSITNLDDQMVGIGAFTKVWIFRL